MAYNDVYTGLSGPVAVAQTTALPICSVFGTAAKRLWVVGVRVKVRVTAAAAGNEIHFQLARPGNTPNASNAAAIAAGGGHDYSSPASVGLFATAYTTAPTVGAILAEWEVPQTTGSAWEEFPPTGIEWGVPAIANNTANAGLHVFAICSAATSTPVAVDIIWGE
jgi:hypothetical protein